MTREIPLSRGRVALVDDADYDWLMQWKWAYGPNSHEGTGYAVRTVRTPIEGIKGGFTSTTIRMHRLILQATEGVEVDHIDGNGLNNTRANLRICTGKQNRRNKPKRQGCASTHKGVTPWKGRWMSRIVIDYKTIYLGLFTSELDAARAYNEAALKYHGEFARLNDIPEPTIIARLRWLELSA